MTRPVVFTGLSLPHSEVDERVEALPPVARGDIDRLLARDEPPTAIGIVDGSFLQGLMLSPKEVLRALDSGVAVLGSSSLGALRAAELDRYGMRGIGRIYRMYRDGEIEADDEVAVTFDPDTHRPLSEPLVNIRIALETAHREGTVSAETKDLVLRTAKDLYFPDRTYRRLLHELGPAVPQDLFDNAPDTKRDDARLLLEELCP